MRAADRCAAALVCPECGATLTVDAAETSADVWRANPGGVPFVEPTTRRVLVAFCSGCEFVLELPWGPR